MLTACGMGSFSSYFSKENYYNFLDASLVGIDDENPLYSLTSYGRTRTYAVRVEYYARVKQKLNVEEWQKYFKDKLNFKEVEDLLYSEIGSLEGRYKKYEEKIDNKDFGKYLYYLSGSNISDLEGAYEVRDTKVSKDFEKFHKTQLTVENDKFLKLRYLFLDMRTAHYSGDYQHTLDLYKNYYSSLVGVKSIVHEWIDALRAGAMQHLGQDVESNWLYAKVLEHKTNAHLGYYDFKIENDTQWKNLLTKAKTADEKAKLYFLRALKWQGSALMEHETIAKIAPNSIWFERLTYMLMQDFQEKAYAYEVNNNKNNQYVKEARKVFDLKEKRFLKTLATLEKPSFFSLYSQTYLAFLREGKLDGKRMANLEKVANKKSKQFVAILKYLEKTIHVNKENQKTLYASLEELSKEVSTELKASLFNYTALQTAKVYPAMSAKRVYSKIFADTSTFNQYFISRDAILADSFEAYVEEKNRNFFEQKLFKKSMYILEKDGVATTLATLYIKDGNFKKAQKYLDQVPKLNRRTEFNPFNVSLSGNNRKVKGKGYDQRKFVKTMLKLEESMKKNPSSAMDHFLYATGRYNSTWFGNFPDSASIWRTMRGFDEEEAMHIMHNFIAIEKEYELALKYAKDDEFKAKVAYQILKIKFNKEILLKNKRYNNGYSYDSFKTEVLKSDILKDAYGKYISNYKNSNYGKEIIGACATFGYFK